MAEPTLRSNRRLPVRLPRRLVSPKYRRSVLVPPVDERLKTVLAAVILEQGAWLQALEVMPDHVHMLVEVDPQFGVHRLLKATKGRSSHRLRQESPHLRSWLPTLWTNSYFVA